MRRLLWAPLFAVLTACPPPIDPGADGGGAIVVGPEGGNFFREGAVIEIPRNAVDVETIITVEVVDEDTIIGTVPNRARISYGYRFRPTTLEFNEPVTLTLPWMDDRIPATGIDPATFDMRRKTGDDPFLQLPSADALPDLKVVRARTETLGLFWITSPLKPAVNEIRLTPEDSTLQVGGTEQFTASVTDPAGNPIPGVEISWSIVPARVARVDDTGLVEALAPGTAILTATAADATVRAEVRVIGTTVGPRSFLHENPFPTGNDLFGGAVENGHLFLVGGNATVLSRDPLGAWTRRFSAPGMTLMDVGGRFPDEAVAVGVSGNAGVLVVASPGQTPSVQLLQTVQPRALWFDGTHGMAVGTGNDVVIRRADQWVTEYSPSFEALLDVVGDGQGGFVTVGDRGSLYQFDPATQTWDSLFQSQLNVLLTGAVIAAPDGSEAWAVGANKLWHFEGAGWTALNLPSSPAVEALTAIGIVDGRIVVGANQGASPYLLAFQPDGAGDGTWTTFTLRPRQTIHAIVSDGSEGYAVGAFGAVWAYSGGSFTEVSSGFYGDVVDVYATEALTVAAVNECLNPPACSSVSGRVMQRDANGAWTELGAPVFGGRLFSVAVKSPTEVYAGGLGSIWRFDGQSWTPQFLSGSPFFDLAVCGGTVWAVGGDGAIFSGPETLAVRPSPGDVDLHAVYCRDDSEVWIAGDQVLLRWPRGAASFTFVFDNAVIHGLYRAVWSPGTNEAYAFGETRYGTYWNSRNLMVYDAPGGILPEALSDMWGSSVDNLYAVGFTVNPLTFGYAVRFNGAQWTLVDTGAQRRPTAIHGFSPTDIFIATEGGGLLRAVPPSP